MNPEYSNESEASPRWRLAWGVFALLALCAPSAVSAASSTFRYGDVHVTFEPMHEGDVFYSYGYLPMSILLRNQSSTAEHRVEISWPHRSWSDSGLTEMRKTVVVQPGATMRIGMYQLPLSMNGHGVRITVDGREYVESFSASEYGEFPEDPVDGYRGRYYTHTGLGSSRQAPLVLLGKGFSPWDAMPLQDLARRHSMAPGGEGNGFKPAMLDVTSWPTDWIGYGGYYAVILTARDAAAAPPGVVTALRRYVRCGGTLLVLGTETCPPGFEPIDADKNIFGYFAYGEESQIFTDSMCKEANLVRHLLSEMPEQSKCDRELPLYKRNPRRIIGMTVLIVLFTLLVGPVLLFVLGKKQKRIFLVWVVPIVSGITCLTVLGYSAVAEGWTVRCRMRVLTILDETHAEATSVGQFGVYAPLTPSRLEFATTTELTPARAISGRERSSRGVDWSSGQTLTGSWVRSRVPAYFRFRKSDVARQRVPIHWDNGVPVAITNGLGTRIDYLVYRSPAGELYRTAGPVEPGQRVTLTPQPGRNAAETEARQQRRSAMGPRGLLRYIVDGNFSHISQTMLKPNRYLARVAESPFVEVGLDNVAYDPRDPKWVLGLVAEDGE